MAEQVQASLDQMVAPLADLMDRKIFSQSEIHSIVARRREYEYLLHRRAPRKSDHLKYIQDELQLEKLRQLRTKKQQAMERERFEKLGRLDEYYRLREGEKMGKNNHIGDPHIKQHIHQLFRRALRKYNRDDVSMYLQYADVCKQLKSFTKLPQVYAEAVQIHPKEPGLWIEAASHEFFHRQSVSAARILLQRALRINPQAKELWLQSFALEFHHIVKMEGRKTVLLDKGGGPAGQQQQEQQQTTFTTTNTISPGLYAIVKIVYDSSIEAIPNDISFRFSFLDLCNNFPNEYTRDIEIHIFATIRQDFQNNPKAWIARAENLLEQKISATTTIALEKNDDDDENAKEEKNHNNSSSKPQGFTVAPTATTSGDNSDTDDDDDNDKKSEKEEDFSDGGSESSDSSTSSNDSDEEERPTKKRRKNSKSNNNEESTTTAAIVYHEDPVLAMIQKAIQAVGTSDMYLESIKFLWSYWEKVELIHHDDHDEPEEKLDDARHDILLFLQDEIFNKAAAAAAASSATDGSTTNNNVYNVSLALEHAEFYTRVDKVEAAKRVLVDYKDAALNSNNSKSKSIRLTPIWLELAELTFQNQQAPGAAAATACVVLKEALKHTPMSHPDYFLLLLNLLGVELIHENNNNNNNNTSPQQQQQQSNNKSSTSQMASMGTFQKVLLLANSGAKSKLHSDDHGSDDDSDDETGIMTRETSFGIKTVEQACWQFLLHMIDLLGPLNGVRKTCDLVLSESNYLQRQTAGSLQDVETIAAFFDKSIEVELANLKKINKKKKMSSRPSSKTELRQGKLRLRQLFDAAIRLFTDVPSLASKFQQERLDASLLL